MSEKHGLEITFDNDLLLNEADKTVKYFDEEEAQQIIEGTLDVT
jgi:hypothetical protein